MTIESAVQSVETLRAAVLGDRDRIPELGLLVGKGPSLARLKTNEVDLTGYLTVGLNHVVTLLPLDIMNAIDLDAVADCAAVIEARTKILAVPYHPHVDFKASEKTIFAFFDAVPILRTMFEQDRLLIYNSSTAKNLPKLKGAPEIVVDFFSSEAGYDLLRLFGARKIHTIGVDGGTRYAEGFESHKPLANGRSSFGHQFLSLNRKFRETGVAFGPVGSVAPIRIFIGCDETQYLASRVLEYSLAMHCDTAIQLKRVDNTGLPIPNNSKKRARTPFSFARFKIPELCNFEGRGIYIDADMIVFDNIRDVWEKDFQGHALLYSQWGRERRPQFSVMLLDCAALPWQPAEIVQLLDREEVSYEDIMFDFKFMDGAQLGPLLPEEWNSLEVYEPTRTKLLHYTDMGRQPWVTKVNENGSLFYQLLGSAMADGFIRRSEFNEEVRKGHVSPGLPSWIGVPKPFGTPSEDTWLPPGKRRSRATTPSSGLDALRHSVRWILRQIKE